MQFVLALFASLLRAGNLVALLGGLHRKAVGRLRLDGRRRDLLLQLGAAAGRARRRRRRRPHDELEVFAAAFADVFEDRHYFALPLNPSASSRTLKAEPRPTMYRVFLSGPAKAMFCPCNDRGIVPSRSPFGLKTCTPPSETT